jgi:hypothetical protein
VPIDESYWAGVNPSNEIIRELLKRKDRDKLLTIYDKRIKRETLDPYFLYEAIQFLRAALINHCSYKYLMKGHYLSIGKVSLYYGYFYIINALLRLHKYAIVHVNYYDDSPIVIVFDQCSDHNFYVAKKCGQSQHKLIWKQFETYYPDLMSSGIGKFFIDDRADWNYDLFYISQATAGYSIHDTEIRFSNNFIDPKYGIYSDEGAAKYYSDLMADTGYEEAGLGQLAKYTIDFFKRINFQGLKEQIEYDFSKIESSEDTKRTILSWFE